MIFFTSDQHLGHANIIKHCFRPFQSTWEMQETIIRNYNNRVGVDDIVYCLGDFFWGVLDVDVSKRFNGHIKLIPGNHDPCHPMRSKRNKFKRIYEQAGIEVLDAQVEYESALLGKVLLCHFPEIRCMTGHDMRFSELRPSYDGVVICGHVHDLWKVKHKSINIGVDSWNFTPVAESELVDTVNALRSGVILQ